MIRSILAGIYFLIWRLWIFLYEHKIILTKKVDSFVVSIGNLTVGGTGKTPFTIFLAQQYQSRGKRVGIVSRGYGGSYKGHFTLVSDGKTIFESPEVVGDEPVLIAKRLGGIPIIVSRDRVMGCQQLIDRFQVNLILLDDGFQHLRIHRDLNLLLVDATQTNDALLPAGPMREPAYAACRANVMILTRSNRSTETVPMIEASGFTGPILKSFFTPVELVHLQKGVSQSVSSLKGAKVLAFCGIGNPDAFTKMLNELGATVLETVLYRDHFHYTHSDIQEIAEQAKNLGTAFIVTTEKDAVKIAGLITEPMNIWAVRIQINFFDSPKVVASLLLNP